MVAFPLLVPNLLWLWVLEPLTFDMGTVLGWVGINLAVVAAMLLLRTNLLAPLQRMAAMLMVLRRTYATETVTPSSTAPLDGLSVRAIAREMGRFAGFALEYYRRHHEVSRDLSEARQAIDQFIVQQQAALETTQREVAQQYQAVLTYAHMLDERVLSQRLDPQLRYDYDEVCEASLNLKLIAGALSMLADPAPRTDEPVMLAALLQQTMLTLAPALDRRAMRLTSAEVDLAVCTRTHSGMLAHVIWMMLLGLIRYAEQESTLRMRAITSRDGREVILSIVVSELAPARLSERERADHLERQLQHLTPHLFADTIARHANLQLATLLINALRGGITVEPLTSQACEICLRLPSA